MSLYRKSVWFMAWMLVVFVATPWWATFLAKQLGGLGPFVVVVLWMGQGGLGVLLLRCPDCGLSLFKNDRDWFSMSTLWPNQTCGECGHDHTAVGPADTV